MKVNLAVSNKTKQFLMPQISNHIPIHFFIKVKGACQHHNLHVVLTETSLIIFKLGSNQDVLKEIRRLKKPHIYELFFQKNSIYYAKKRQRNPKSILLRKRSRTEKATVYYFNYVAF